MTKYIVYLVKNDCIKQDPFKIGWSSLTIFKRCANLSKSAAITGDFEPMCWLEVQSEKMAKNIEASLHLIFDSSRAKNGSEWFYISYESALEAFKTYAKLYKTEVKFPSSNYKEIYDRSGEEKNSERFNIYKFGAKDGDEIVCKTKAGIFQGTLDNSRVAYNDKSYAYGKFAQTVKGTNSIPDYKKCLFWNGKRFDKLIS